MERAWPLPERPKDGWPTVDAAGRRYADHWIVDGTMADPMTVEAYGMKRIGAGTVDVRYDPRNHEYQLHICQIGSVQEKVYWTSFVCGDSVFETEEEAKTRRLELLRAASARAWEEFTKIEKLRRDLGD